MPDRFLVLPPEFLSDGVFVPPSMVEDLRTVAELSNEAIDMTSAAIDAWPGILDFEGLKDIVGDSIGDDNLAAATLRAIRNIEANDVEQTLETLRKWRLRSDDNASRLPEPTMAALADKLPRLIRPYASLQLYRKARRLAQITGDVAGSIELICDLRPVFNETRDQVEALIPLTTLKVTFDDDDENERVTEVLLSREMVEELITKAQNAKKKLEALCKSIEQWVPDGTADVL